MIIHTYNFILLSFLSLVKRNNKNLMIFLLIVFSVLDGIRYNCYFDYSSYKTHFYSEINENLFEKGYSLFVDFFRMFHSYNLMLFIISILIYYFIFYKNYKLLNYNPLYISLAFTQIIPFLGVNRQLLSLVFLSIGINFLLKNNIVIFLFCCILGSFFHITALVLIPLGIFCSLFSFNLRNNIKIIIFFLIITHIFIFYDINNIIKSLLSINAFFNKYTIYLLKNEKYTFGIFHYLIRNFEIVFPILFLIQEREKMKDNDLNVKVFNISLIGLLVYYFIYFTFYGKFQILVSRIGLTLRGLFIPMYYTSIYNILQNKKNKEILLIVSLIIFGILFFKIIYGEESYQYIYKTIF